MSGSLAKKEVLHATKQMGQPSRSCQWRHRTSFSDVWRGPAKTGKIASCPLGKVFTYKNLIYVLNLQFSL